MCPVCIQNIGIVLVGLTSSTGLTALVMAQRESQEDARASIAVGTAEDESIQGERHV